jgi:hypothetical protein
MMTTVDNRRANDTIAASNVVDQSFHLNITVIASVHGGCKWLQPAIAKGIDN